MTPLRKNQFTWLTLMLVGLLLIALALYVSNWFILPFVALIFGGQFILGRIVCSQCGTPVTFQGQLFGKSVYGGFIRRRCQACGADLNLNG